MHSGKVTYGKNSIYLYGYFCISDDIYELQSHLRRVEIQRALDAGAHARYDDSAVSFEALGAAIYQRNDARLIQYAIFVVQ